MLRSLTLCLCVLPVLAFADGTGATKPPPGYPAFLPWVAGGLHEKDLSSGKTCVLTYAEGDAGVAKKIRAALEKAGFKLEPDDIEGMSGTRFNARKGETGAYFTIKPNAGSKTKTQVIVTDTSGLK